MSQSATVTFEFNVGDFVVRRSPFSTDSGRPMPIIGRAAVDNGRGFVVEYHVRLGLEQIVALREHELESWEVYAVRSRLTERELAREPVRVGKVSWDKP